jgi:hypothetical protein
MYVCVYVCVCVCMYVCMYIFIYISGQVSEGEDSQHVHGQVTLHGHRLQRQGTHFTCFTSTKMQKLTPEALGSPGHGAKATTASWALLKPAILNGRYSNLLALLVQKYKY